MVCWLLKRKFIIPGQFRVCARCLVRSWRRRSGGCGYRAIAKGVYGDESFYKTVRQEMAKQLLFSTPSIYPAEANRTPLSLLLAITGPKEGTMSDFSHWFNDLSHAGIAVDAFGRNMLIAARRSSRMKVFLPVGTVWAPGAESAPVLGSFSMASIIGMRLLWIRANAVVTKLLIWSGLRFSDGRRIAPHHEDR